MQRIISGLISFLLVFSISQAQKPNYKFRTINQSNGLANGTVQAIFEDSYGLIWLGTHQGLQRYDGASYTHFMAIDGDSTGLSENFIVGFCEDADRNIWISTSAGLNKYSRKTDDIKKYTWKDKSITENGEPGITALISDPSDRNILWLTITGTGLIRLDVSTDSTIIYTMPNNESYFSSWILPYKRDDSKLLTGSIELMSFDKNTGEFTKLLALEQDAEFPNNLINAASFDPGEENVVWLATGDIWGRGNLGGIIKYNLISGVSTMFTAETRPEEIPVNHFLSIGFQGENKLWLGTRMNGLMLYLLDEDKFYTYSNNDYDEGSFVTTHAVRSILQDRSGTCWFGTWGDGISILSPAAQKFTHYKHLPDKDNDLSDNYINAFAEDKYGNIWIGTETGGLSVFDPVTKSFTRYYQEFRSAGKNPTIITSLLYDSHDNLWIGTYDNALHRYDLESGTKTHFPVGPGNVNKSQARITAISELSPGEILISTYGAGLNIFNYETNSFRNFMNDPQDSSSLPDNQIWLPFLGNDGNYYFSGNSKAGLIQFNPRTEKFHHFTELKLTAFLAPVKAGPKKIYIDDTADGLKLLLMEDEPVASTVYDINGNNISNVESILMDNNKLWLGTGNGLVEFDPESRFAKRYDADDGLQGYSFNRFASLKASTGEMYFGGQNGFNVFHPEKISFSSYEPAIIFTDFKLYQESVTIGEDSPLKENILMTEELILHHSENDFSVAFAALDYSNPDKIEYKYMLENHDENWIMSGYSNIASYTNMDPGEYVLKVMSTNGDGIWNDKTASINITIKPPWWKTNWAYIGYGLLFIAGVILVDRVQRKRLVEKEKTLAREKELEQAKEIEKAYTRLQDTQQQLLHAEKMASLGELTAGIAHEIQNPLNFVNNFSEVNRELIAELMEEIDKGELEEVKAIAKDIERNEKKITHHGMRADGIVKGMLQHSRTAPGEKLESNVNIIADEYLRLSYHGLRAKDKSFNAEFITDFDKSLPQIKIVPQDIGRVLLNLINNAFHAVYEKRKKGISEYKPLVTVSTKRKSNTVLISVKDNGDGIPQKNLEKIFQPFFTTKPAGEGTGLGLSISYDIITKGHGGEMKVETSEGTGTEFIISLTI